MDFALGLTKFLAILFSGIFAVLAIIANYKDTQRNITKWGRLSLILAIISSVVAALSLSFEVYKTRLDAKAATDKALEEIKRNNSIISEINRNLNMIREVKIDFLVTIPSDHPELVTYRTRLEKGIKEVLSRKGNNAANFNERDDKEVFPCEWDSDNVIFKIAITPQSSLFPNRKIESFAYHVFKDPYFLLQFCKEPIDIDEYSHNGKHRTREENQKLYDNSRINLSILFMQWFGQNQAAIAP
jgi:hypothetical protein